MSEILEELQKIFSDNIIKEVISKTGKTDTDFIKFDIEKKQDYFQVSKYTQKQVFHENVNSDELIIMCNDVLGRDFLQFNSWSESYEYSIKISKKGKVFSSRIKQNKKQPLKIQSAHNRKKSYIFEEGKPLEVLVDMGIFTKEAKVVKSMYDKYKQINRFIEIIDDAVRKEKCTSLNIIDFGCGKSYLSFLVYHYLCNIKHIKVNMIGLDLKEEVINNCNSAAKKYGYEGLSFKLGNINGYKADFIPDMVISLHACDTASDYALFNAIKWGAKMIFCVPCCQHELAGQFSAQSFNLMGRYGLIKARFCDLLTDSIRANLLEYSSYDTDILEFVDFSHTPKNILIRAVLNKNKSKQKKEKALEEVKASCSLYGLTPTLLTLLKYPEV
jgi:hypothetical protein